MEIIEFFSFFGKVILGASAIAILALLVGAIFNLNISDNARRTLWGIFWAGVIVGGLILLFAYGIF